MINITPDIKLYLNSVGQKYELVAWSTVLDHAGLCAISSLAPLSWSLLPPWQLLLYGAPVGGHTTHHLRATWRL